MTRFVAPALPWLPVPLWILVATGLSGCDIVDPVACTDEFVLGLHVEAVDSLDGDPVTQGLAGFALQGDYAEEMEGFENQLFGAGERPGTYAVLVTAPGFRPWVRTGVRVQEGRCHVVPVKLTARLVK